MADGKHPGGQPTKYDPAYCEALVQFFQVKPYEDITVTQDGMTVLKRLANDPPHFIDFAQKIGVHIDTLYEWRKVHPEFEAAMKTAKALLERHYLTCGFLGLSNPQITSLVLKANYGYRERTEVEHSGHVDGPSGKVVVVQVMTPRVEANEHDVSRVTERADEPRNRVERQAVSLLSEQS